MKLLLSLALSFVVLAASAQPTYFKTEPRWTEKDTAFKYHVVRGERHGMSYFKKHQFPEVQYAAGDKLTFDTYHTPDVMYTWYQKWAELYPDITDLYEIGRSFEGRPILQMTITNKKTGKHTDKPAAYFEGGRHSGEITSSESVLWLTQHLLENYGKDQSITQLVDTKTIYVRPENNPDGATMYLFSAQRNRSTVRPKDNDRDGLLDEDGEDDLDADGIMYQMRKKAVTPEDKEKANFIADTRDPSGKLMKRVKEGEGEWLVYSEGIDNDGDGKYNEDGIGGLDLHRNYTMNWHPDEGGDYSGRGYTQGGAGEYPLSENETRATVVFLLSHPHVSVVNSMDTSVPMHLRGPSTSKSAESVFPSDLKLFRHFDSLGLSFTNYPWAGDVYEVYNTRSKINRFTGEPTKPSPLFGHGPDFGYFIYGTIWYGDELWNHGAMKDYNKDGDYDDYDALMWDNEGNGGKGFKPWTKFQHPVLGEIEMGGFHPKFFSQNGPPHQLENWAAKEARFNLAMAKELPQIEITDVTTKALANNEYEIRVKWTNTGKLPVALEQAKRVKIVQEDRLTLEIDKELTKGGKDAQVTIVTPSLTDKTIYAGYTGVREKREAVFKVKLKEKKETKIKVKLSSTRGGLKEREVILK
jgi:hypothetical protein